MTASGERPPSRKGVDRLVSALTEHGVLGNQKGPLLIILDGLVFLVCGWVAYGILEQKDAELISKETMFTAAVYRTGPLVVCGLFLSVGVAYFFGLISTISKRLGDLFESILLGFFLCPFVFFISIFSNLIGNRLFEFYDFAFKPSAMVIIVAGTAYPIFQSFRLGINRKYGETDELIHSFGGGASALAIRLRLPSGILASLSGVKIAIPIAFLIVLITEGLTNTRHSVGGLVYKHMMVGADLGIIFAAMIIAGVCLMIYGVADAVDVWARNRSSAHVNPVIEDTSGSIFDEDQEKTATWRSRVWTAVKLFARIVTPLAAIWLALLILVLVSEKEALFSDCILAPLGFLGDATVFGREIDCAPRGFEYLRDEIWNATKSTVKRFVTGVPIGIGFAFAMALAVHLLNRPMIQALISYPIVISQSIPIVLFIPFYIFLVDCAGSTISVLLGYEWSGNATNDWVMYLVVISVTFFPAYEMILAGLRSAPERYGHLMTALGGRAFHRLRHFDSLVGLRYSIEAIAVLSPRVITGLIVAEAFVSLPGGWGQEIEKMVGRGDKAEYLIAMFVITGISVLVYNLFRALGAFLLRCVDSQGLQRFSNGGKVLEPN